MTVITRPGSDSASALPAGLTVLRVDYTDVDALAATLAGQDAVVSAVGPGAIGAAKGMVDAAARVGVRRYISESSWLLSIYSSVHLVIYIYGLLMLRLTVALLEALFRSTTLLIYFPRESRGGIKMTSVGAVLVVRHGYLFPPIVIAPSSLFFSRSPMKYRGVDIS